MIKAKATISAKYTPTGRYVTCEENYETISTWSKLETYNDLINHPTYRIVSSEFSQLRLLKGSSICLYRGRPKCQVFCPSALKMGPPPSKPTIPGGRYNTPGESVLYLADSEYGVKRELAGRASKILVQEFTIPISTLSIADLTVYDTRSIINAVMWHCELANSEGYPSFVFSQTIAMILKEKGFDGAMAFGVRGDSQETYNNIFIFNPVPRWKNWVNLRMDPYLVRITIK